ncbi:unnamed protein product [Diabrotica balteata]|uniref:EF-hand domain-containing protein n=1 Tax=Diabrotica balteata TaxID=107213 RepID=A0A9P0DVR8_DIABA|nr:unnamed protein product [Diabrotica balteata]
MKQKSSNILLAVFLFHLVLTIASGNSLQKTLLENYQKCINDKEEKDCLALFNELDTNGDGKISHDESEPFLEKLARSYILTDSKPIDSRIPRRMVYLLSNPIQDMFAEFFIAADANKDDKLTFNEFKKTVTLWKYYHDQLIDKNV